jgi:acyl-homoserine-lactone acylase
MKVHCSLVKQTLTVAAVAVAIGLTGCGGGGDKFEVIKPAPLAPPPPVVAPPILPAFGSDGVLQAKTNPTLIQIKQIAGFTLLPGFKSAFDFNAPVPYANAPKYEGTDYVQNSNDSFWLTNFENPITGGSPLYGQVGNEQSLRSRMAHKLLANASGSDGKFNMVEVEEALLSNRHYLSDAILPELLSICQANRENDVDVSGRKINLGEGCDGAI